MKSELPVKFQSADLMSVPIVLPPVPVKKRKKNKEALIEAAAFARFGVHSLRVKAETLAALGKVAEAAGIKQIGHGRIILAADNAEGALRTLGAFVDDLVKKGENTDHKLIVEIMRMVHAFNEQLIKTAEAHLTVDKQPSSGTSGQNMTMAFPSGSPVVIAVGQKQGAVEDGGTGT